MSKDPHFGFTRLGHAVHARTADHLPHGSAAARFNSRLGVAVTKAVGSMWCAYIFTLLALLSLPAVLTQAGFVPETFFPHWLVAAGLIALVAWIAQTFLQLVLLSIIIVGQDVQSQAADARSALTFEHTNTIMDRVDENTQGGIKAVLDAQASDTRTVLAAVAAVNKRLDAIEGLPAAIAKAAAAQAAVKPAGRIRS
jgi:hypothetical protein